MRWVPCRLTHILVEEQTDSQVITLAELEGERRLPIVIGPMEAAAINRAVTSDHFGRPLTHDLMVQLLEATGHHCVGIRIVALLEGTFYAELVLRDADGTEIEIDCRPSDAIALQVRLPHVPLVVAEEVFAAHHG